MRFADLIYRRLALLILSIVFLGCTTRSSQGITEAPVFERGLHIFPSPRTYDAPGTIFRVDSDGIRRSVADLSGLLSLEPQPEAIPRIRVQGAIDLGVLFAWLGGTSRRLSYERLDSAVVEVVGAKRERAFEVDLRPLLDSAHQLIDWTREGQVYLITETVLADSVSFHLGTSVALAADDSTRRDSSKVRGVAVRWEPQAGASLALRFEQPHRVFYKVDQLVRRSALEPDSLGRIIRLPWPRPLRWSELP